MGTILTVALFGKIIDQQAETFMGAAPLIVIQAIKNQLKDVQEFPPSHQELTDIIEPVLIRPIPDQRELFHGILARYR